MDGLEYWKLCDSFTVVQAALLIIGVNPTGYDYIDRSLSHDRPDNFNAAFAALKNAINDGKLKATIRREAWEQGWNENPEQDERMDHDERGKWIIYKAYPDWDQSTVSREDLTEWLFNRNFKPPFFFEQPKTTDSLPDYLDKEHPQYSPKLAAAVRAWEAVTTDPKYRNNGKTAKANLARWLTAHAGEFGLVKEGGEINADAIKNQIAKVANWDREGGAPKTPGG